MRMLVGEVRFPGNMRDMGLGEPSPEQLTRYFTWMTATGN